jgi:chorismate mutase
MKNSISIREVVVNATEDALNAAVSEHQIEPDKIISVIFQPRKELATATRQNIG